MTDPIRDELHELLHGATLGEQLSCDYHDSPTGFVPAEIGTKRWWSWPYVTCGCHPSTIYYIRREENHTPPRCW